MTTQKEDVLKICEKHYSKKPVNIRKYHSSNNDVYLLIFRDFERVLKIAKPENGWMVDKELYIFDMVSKGGIPVPRIEHFDTTCSLLPNHYYIATKIGNRDLNQLYNSGEDVKNLFVGAGKIFAKIHSIKFSKQGFILADKIERKKFLEDIKSESNWSLKKLHKSGKISAKNVEMVSDIVSKSRDQKEACLCHHDFGPHHILIENKKISGVIDWEWAKSSSSIYDIAKTEILTNLFAGNFNLILEGYKKVRKIPKDYDHIKESYQLVEIVKLMQFFNEIKPNKKIFEKCKGLFRSIVDNYDK